MSKRDYYEVLGISKGASSEEIKKAFRTKRNSSIQIVIQTIQMPKLSSRRPTKHTIF